MARFATGLMAGRGATGLEAGTKTGKLQLRLITACLMPNIPSLHNLATRASSPSTAGAVADAELPEFAHSSS